MRLPLRILTSLGAVLPALALPAIAGAQDYSDLPPLAPVSEAEMRALPPEYRAAPMVSQTAETVTAAGGVETITRTRRIDRPHRLPASPAATQAQPNQGTMHHSHAALAYAPAPVVFEREQWLDECRRRTAGRKKKHRYDCDAALDGYLSQYGAPGARIAAREIAYSPYQAAPSYAYGYGYPVNYGYAYAPPPQIVLVPVLSEVQQQAVVRETVREETYTVPGAARVIPAPAPSTKMIKGTR